MSADYGMMGGMSTGDTSAGRRVDALDYLRFAAAASVVFFHYGHNGMANGKIASLSLDEGSVGDAAKYGYLGVELFFLISGFVIFQSASGKTAREFAVGRAVRLLPAFWVAMLVTAAVTATWGASSGLSVSGGQILGNLTMTPGLFGVAPVDGVYWTLLLELAFYLFVFAVLASRLRAHLPLLLSLVAVALLLAALLAPASVPLVWTYSYFALFVGGAMVAHLASGARSRLVPGLGLAVSAVVALAYAALRAKIIGQASPLLAVALVVLAYVALALVASPRVRRVRLPGSTWAGGLTYPLYLLHAHIGFIVLSRFADEQNRAWMYGVTLALVGALATALHVFERRTRGFWISVFGRLTLPKWSVGSVDAVQPELRASYELPGGRCEGEARDGGGVLPHRLSEQLPVV